MGLRELVVMVDDDGAAGPEDERLRAAGFGVVVIDPDALHARYHLEALSEPESERAANAEHLRAAAVELAPVEWFQAQLDRVRR